MREKIILLYPYYDGISGAYNRFLLLEKLLKKANLKVKIIKLHNKEFNLFFIKIIFKFFKFLKVESIIFFYSILKNYYFITDFNPSIIALFSKNVFIQIHDVSWDNKHFARYSYSFYGIFKFFIKYYLNILTVSRTSMKAIKKLSGRKKRISYLYNSVNEIFIKESNNMATDNKYFENKFITESINLDLPNILYIATLIPRKCHLDLLEALSKSDLFFNLNLIGRPTDKKILEFIQTKKTLRGNSIKSNINYFPKVSQKDLCELLIYSSAYISTSMNEGFGIPVLEAQLYNIPLIIRDIDINRELFPKAQFFKSTIELTNLLNNIKKISKSEIKKRKKIVSNINEDNLLDQFNYSVLSKELKSIIFEST